MIPDAFPKEPNISSCSQSLEQIILHILFLLNNITSLNFLFIIYLFVFACNILLKLCQNALFLECFL